MDRHQSGTRVPHGIVEVFDYRCRRRTMRDSCFEPRRLTLKGATLAALREAETA
jgi:hypothetical protein